MQISNIHIKNFRGIKDLSIDLDDFIVLIGENNAGKSTILDAIRHGLSSRHVFGEYDYHLGCDVDSPSEAEPIEIFIVFSEKEEGEWPNGISQIFDDVVQPDEADDLRKIILHVYSKYDSRNPQAQPVKKFLNLKKEELTTANARSFMLRLNEIAPVFYLPTTRDAPREFSSRSEFWKPFIQPQEIEETLRLEMEKKLQDINGEILETQTDFSNIKTGLQEASKIVDIANKDKIVSIESIPSKIFDVLKNTRVYFLSKANAMLPITSHGEGTQSTSVILLFKEFIKEKLSTYHEFAEPIIAMEEPEAHLHPAACRGLAKIIPGLRGQKIITTHSGDFLSEIDLYSIRRISCKDGETKIHKIIPESLDNDVINKINIKIRYDRGNLLFARCWLLVEGETESILFPECARSIGKDLFANGVHCVEYSNIGIGVTNLIKIAESLGISWIMFADNDRTGKDNMDFASEFLECDQYNEYIFHTDMQDIETLLQSNGFSQVYGQSPLSKLKSEKKIKKAIKVVECIQQDHADVPARLKEVIIRACELGRNV